ncbi:MAG: DNRLRE domain-containing protein [Gammaproteobacteria bacterium]|nr:DNRLRE domain-containing protein [Gammaproteobacteria bacterium]
MEITIEDGIDGGILTDTFIIETNPDDNYGDFTALKCGTFDRNRPLHNVNLSAYAGATVLSAKFRCMFEWTNWPDIEWYRVLRDWSETTATWNIYDTAASWTSVGCNGVGTDREGTIQGSLTNVSAGWRDLTLIPASVTEGCGTFFSIMTRAYDDSTPYANITSNEAVSNHPSFYMEYTEAPVSTGGIPRSRIINLGGI